VTQGQSLFWFSFSPEQFKHVVQKPVFLGL
jgi:hypothetical protein